jgi:D-alanine--D-alanine ligase
MDPRALLSAREAALAALEGRHVLILCGGDDEEAPVSLAAAEKVTGALRSLQISHEIVGPAELLPALHRQRNAVVNNILYGPTGEGGAMAGLLAGLGVPVTYSNARSSAIALDKWRTKLLLGASVRTTWSVVFNQEECNQALDEVVSRANWPVVCKPLKLGCSIGIDVARDVDELITIVRATTARFGLTLVEPFLSGDEFSIGVLQPPHLPTRALPVLRVRYSEQMVATQNIKYGDGQISFECPARIQPELVEELSAMALTAYHELGCSPLVRVDFRCDDQGRPYLLEVNHHPGMTPHSWYPIIASHVGIDYPTLLLIVLHAAITRAEQQATIQQALLSPDQIRLAGLSDDVPGPIAISIDTDIGWTKQAAGDLQCISPQQIVNARGGPSRNNATLLLDLMYEDDRSLDWRAVLEGLGYRRIGPSLLSCALSQDKRYQRLVAGELAITQPSWTTLTRWRASPGELPSVAKRRTSWQSRHVVVLMPGVKALSDIEDDQSDDWLVEDYVPGDEYHVGLLSLPRGRLYALPVARIRGTTEPWILDEGRKMSPELIEIEFIDPSDRFVADLVASSKKLMKAFDMPPFARAEWRRETNGLPVFLEFDNCPGLGEHSIVTRMLRHVSITLAEVVRDHLTDSEIIGVV